MGKVRIVADSTCDLNKAILEKYEISIIPLCIIMDDRSYYDGEEITPEEIFEWADSNNTTPKTAATTFDRAVEIMKPFMDAGEEIIFFGISSSMSNTCNVIRIVGDKLNYDKLYIIDSQSLSTGIGLQVVKAAQLAEEGKSAKDIVSIIESKRADVRASFVVDTLTYLERGGRCNAVTALLGNALKLHPVIYVENGEMQVGKKYRGNLEASLTKYAKDLKAELLKADPSRVFITHSGCDAHVVAEVRECVKNLAYFDEIIETKAGGVISSHCGPRTLGILYYEK